MTTKIYGASDDLIEIEGFTNDEINCYDHKKPIKITCSDGTIATIFYDGKWTIKIKKVGTNFLRLIDSVGDDNEHEAPYSFASSYSDILILADGIEWVKIKGKLIE